MNPGTTIEFPDGTQWQVIARIYSTEAQAKSRWEQIERERGVDLSVWRTLTPELYHCVVVCGREEEIRKLGQLGGADYQLDENSALRFALRRLKVGSDAYEAGETERFSQVARYGTTPAGGVVIKLDGTVGAP